MAALAIGFIATQSLPRREEMVPLGGIIEWSGAIVDIPTGWQLCDGTNGTPDLRGRFIIGAGGSEAVNEVGGSETHDHSFNGDGHAHAASVTIPVAGSGPSTAWSGPDPSNDGNSEGTTDSGSNVPPFLALAYIQRMV